MWSPINQNCVFNSIWMLKLRELAWVEVVSKGEIPTTRYSHCATTFDTKIIVFGGLNGKQYSRSNVYIAEMSKHHVRNLVYEDKIREKE
jgi:hypothetical protein